MRTVRLLQAAAQAEALRLRREVRRMAIRAALLAAAAGFLGLGIGFAHLWFWWLLLPRIGSSMTAAILALGDLAIAAGFVLLAARVRPDRLETEARLVSIHAWRGVHRTWNGWADAGELIIPLAQVLAACRRRRSASRDNP